MTQSLNVIVPSSEEETTTIQPINNDSFMKKIIDAGQSGYNSKINQSTEIQKTEDIIQKAIDEARAEKYENWEREDQIRKETQEREDNAYQRAVEDMIKAGINPAIFGVSPASSGGGITSATKSDYTIATEMLNEAFESKENSKDRAVKLLTAIFAILGIAIKGKKK